MNGPRSLVRAASPVPALGLALALLGAAAPEARGQWVVAPGVAPGFGGPWGGVVVGPGFGPVAWAGGFGFGYGVPAFAVPPTAVGYGYGYGIYPGAFSVLNQPDVQAGLAYNALATGRLAPYSYNANPFAVAPGFGGVGSYWPGFGPFGYAGAASYNPYFSAGLSPLAVQSAIEEMALSRSSSPIRIRVVPAPGEAQGPADPAAAPVAPRE